MAYSYLLSYVKVLKYGTQQIETSISSLTKPITTSKDVEKIEADLKKSLKAEQIALLSLSPLKGEI